MDIKKDEIKVQEYIGQEEVIMNTQNKWDIKKMILTYIHEFFEVFVSILIIRMAMDKEVELTKVVKASAAIGLVTFILENYDTNFNSNIKQGITFSVGSQMMSTFMN
jgi:hypothetical protein